MDFAVYVLKDDPDFAIFDVDLSAGVIVGATREEWTPVAVFSCDDGEGHFYWPADAAGNYPPGTEAVFGKLDCWRFVAQELLTGVYVDRDSGQEAPIKCLWRATVTA